MSFSSLFLLADVFGVRRAEGAGGAGADGAAGVDPAMLRPAMSRLKESSSITARLRWY